MSRVQVPSIAPFSLEALLNVVHALILGIIQGLAEFFPISSSAHLCIAKRFLGLPLGEELLYFDLSCHSATLLVLIVYLRKEAFAILKDARSFFLYCSALAPLIPAYFFLKPARQWASNPSYLGIFLLCTAFLLFFASRTRRASESAPLKAKNMIYIGIMQAMALIPGISRSGATMAAGRFLGWDWLIAAKVSFLLAIPTILGGQILETWSMARGGRSMGAEIPLLCYAVGFMASLIAGAFSIRAAFFLYRKGKMVPISGYCFGLGLFALWALHGS